MFAVFGEITFELLTAPDSLTSAKRWEYAEHRVIEDRPRLQWVGDGLETITLEMMFHASFTDPAAQLAALIAVASDHNARPLIFGNGEYRGYFILWSMRTISSQTSDAGDAIAISVRAELREWPLDSEVDPNAPPQPVFPPVAIVDGSSDAPTGPSLYAAPAGFSGGIFQPSIPYVAPALSAPGVSPMLNNPTGGAGSNMLPGDVATSIIVRASI